MSDRRGRHMAGGKEHAIRARRVPVPGSVTGTMDDTLAMHIAEAVLRFWQIELVQFALFAGATDQDEAFAASAPYFLAASRLAARILESASHSREGTWARFVAEAHGDGNARSSVRDMELGHPCPAVRAIMDEALGGRGLVWQPSGA